MFAIDHKMLRSKSFQLNDIKSYIEAGGSVTHILNIEVANEESDRIGNALRDKLFSTIANKPVVIHINGLDIPIEWKSTATASSAYYYSHNPMFTDAVIKAHTKRLLTRFLDENRGLSGAPGLTYFVMKPLDIDQAMGLDSVHP